MSEYLSSILWRHHEERMSQQLEYRRVAQERLSEQVQEQQLQHQRVLDVSLQAGVDALAETELEQEFEPEVTLEGDLMRR